MTNCEVFVRGTIPEFAYWTEINVAILRLDRHFRDSASMHWH